MGQTNGFAWNKWRGAMFALVLAPWCLLHFDPPRSFLFACSLLCSAWYEAFGLLPNIRRNATLPDIYQAFRAMPAEVAGSAVASSGCLASCSASPGCWCRGVELSGAALLFGRFFSHLAALTQ